MDRVHNKLSVACFLNCGGIVVSAPYSKLVAFILESIQVSLSVGSYFNGSASVVD